MAQPELFISYRREDRSTKLVRELVAKIETSAKGFKIITDEKDLSVRGDIGAFMERLGKGDYVILVLSKGYFESRHCMKELLIISRHKQLKERVFPIVFSEVKLQEPRDVRVLVKHWQDEYKKFSSELEELDEEFKSPELMAELSFLREIAMGASTAGVAISELLQLMVGDNGEMDHEDLIRHLEVWVSQGARSDTNVQNEIAEAEKYYNNKEYEKSFPLLYKHRDHPLFSAKNQKSIGYCYDLGQGTICNYSEAVKWYRKAAEQEDTKAQNNLGLMYLSGNGVPKDKVEAVKWFRKAAVQGEATAQCNLGIVYYEGNGVTKDDVEAVKWFRKAAEQEDINAQNNLGLMYLRGDGVPKDNVEAVKWFRKAAEQGEATAQNNLGAMYNSGAGVPKDDVEAVKWYQKAAEQGDSTAQHNLGAMYNSGAGVPKDDVEAVKWYQKAADQEYPSAQNNLGNMYENGTGVPKKDRTEAIRLYRLAAKGGNQLAKDNLKRLGVSE